MASSDHCTTAVPGLSRQGSGLIMYVCNNNTTTKAAANQCSLIMPNGRSDVNIYSHQSRKVD